jgi:hypothetical protein
MKGLDVLAKLSGIPENEFSGIYKTKSIIQRLNLLVL